MTDILLKTNVIKWKITIFNRKYIDSFMADFPASHVSELGGVHWAFSPVEGTIQLPAANAC